MLAFRTVGAEVRGDVPSEHRLSLDELTLVLYNANEQVGAGLGYRVVRKAVNSVLEDSGTRVVDTIRDYLSDAFGSRTVRSALTLSSAWSGLVSGPWSRTARTSRAVRMRSPASRPSL
ncbi:hypothetical protein [Streptomyces sp. NPDC051173]|uniref:hypothetical protein n=1 Tax=Streptomyces sp. NPDC051173 TaxID=3155164 RepID=UPI00344CFC23